MRTFRRARSAVMCLALLAPLGALAQPRFTIEFDAQQQPGPYSGRVYVAMLQRSSASGPEPRQLITNWFRPPQVISLDVTDVPPGGSITIDAATPGLRAFPRPLSSLTDGTWAVQGIARRSLDHPVPGQGAGDLHSIVALADAAKPEPLALKLSNVVAPRPFAETDRVKLVEIVSPLLSEFHKREVKVRASVVLPKAWSDQPDRTWPALYYINGFGGDHRSAGRIGQQGGPADDVLQVVPDPTCAWGHSVFADSATNGPWGRVLVEELIPAVETKYRGPAAPGGGGGERRYVWGISSGGWSSLWLQVTYPDAFSGCWSHVPDPVDFRDFQQINLYRDGENMYRDAGGQRRPLARMGDRVSLYYDDFVAMEDVLGHGGQIASFEAVFSPREPDGSPRRLFDRATGRIDPQTAKAWERYDIRLVLERNWAALAPRLKGKIHVIAGEKDTFYLQGAAALLQQALSALGSDAQVTVVPGMPHTIHQPSARAMFEAIARRETERAAPPAPAAPAGAH
ncbi:MAG: alpha/beta hydrolase [Phycisphaerae bacterium]|nr:alpha/beta hydrolase [Phycisphaerae bacterium]